MRARPIPMLICLAVLCLNASETWHFLPTDPHHADTADISIQTYVISHERTISETIMDIRNFANNYSGTWSWPFGQNCHSFQNSMVNSVRLIKEDELP